MAECAEPCAEPYKKAAKKAAAAPAAAAALLGGAVVETLDALDMIHRLPHELLAPPLPSYHPHQAAARAACAAVAAAPPLPRIAARALTLALALTP
eukprot:scaffold39934_cov36-Phaeocystis_antarctica.AAC.2